MRQGMITLERCTPNQPRDGCRGPVRRSDVFEKSTKCALEAELGWPSITDAMVPLTRYGRQPEGDDLIEV
jgi:hypothetical protein